MKNEEYQVWKTAAENVYYREGRRLAPPQGWIFVPSGDPGLTRRLKTSGECWTVVHRRKNRIEALGLLTDGARVAGIRSALESERADPAYQHRMEAAKKRREAEQDAYVVEFRQAVVDFLRFAPRWKEAMWRMADYVTDQAVPVGSGTVARTERIPLERRAEAAVIAWMRHQTTAYDHMTIARIRGERREVRHELAERSRAVLAKYRSGEDFDLKTCPLAKALGLI